MKKLTQLITESSIIFDDIEDVMIHLQDMGFKITIFNDLGSFRGLRNTFFGPGHFDDIYHKMNSYAFEPSDVNCYPVYVIALSKEFHPFSDCDLYLNVIKEAEVIRKRLRGCKVYYRIDTTSITGASMDSGIWGDIKKNLQITFHITHISSKISRKSINDRKSILEWLHLVVKTYKLTNIYSTRWGMDDITIGISTSEGHQDDIKKALVVLESQENLDKIIKGYKISKKDDYYNFLERDRHNILVTYSPV